MSCFCEFIDEPFFEDWVAVSCACSVKQVGDEVAEFFLLECFADVHHEFAREVLSVLEEGTDALKGLRDV
jgi:hypothetical protein